MFVTADLLAALRSRHEPRGVLGHGDGQGAAVTPADAAGVATFIACDRAGAVTGTVVPVTYGVGGD